MRLPALAAQLQGFAHSANNVDVGVSLRKVNCWQKVWGGLIPTYKLRTEGVHSLCNHLDVRVKSSSRASFARRSAFFDMENVYFEDDVGVSPRKVNCWQKVWGGLIPTYESTLKVNCS